MKTLHFSIFIFQILNFFKKILTNQLDTNCPNLTSLGLSYFKDFVDFNDAPCILMEHLGPSIYDMLQKQDQSGLPLRTIQQALGSIFLTLKNLSSIGVMHGDVKSENILQCKTNKSKFKLVDYHCSAIVGRPNSFYVQSIFIRAPEVLLRIDYTPKIDVWSLAASAYEMFIGFPLFPAETEIQLFTGPCSTGL